jgi:hypothetical protein
MKIKYILIISALVFMAMPVTANKIAFVEFTQTAKFNAHWDLKKDLPLYLSSRINKPLISLPFDTTEMRLKAEMIKPSISSMQDVQQAFLALGADYIISADVSQFVIKKRVAGDGQMAGLKSYLAECRLRLHIFSRDTLMPLRTEEVYVNLKDNNTAVNIGRLSKDEQLYDSLSIVAFGSATFERSIAGIMMHDLVSKVNTLLLTLPVRAAVPTGKTLIKVAKIVDIQGEDVYINSGFEEKLIPGDVCTVFIPGDTIFDPDTKEFLGITEKVIGSLKIIEVKASRFSRTRAVENGEYFKLFNLVKIER